MTVQIRNFTEENLSSLVKLLNGTRKGSYEFIPINEQKLRSQIKEWDLKILVAEEEGEIIGSVAYNNGHWGEEIEWLCVRENPNRKHLENLLVTEIEKHVKSEKIFTVVDAESPKINEWTERGYKPEGGLCHMIATIDTAKPIPKVPEGTIISSLKPEEEKDFTEAVNAGFDHERLKQGVIQRWRSECPPFSEEWIHVAKIDNKIVSVVVSRPDVKHNKFFGGKRGYLGPAATLSKYRGKNLASALTRRAMNALFEKGMNPVALYTTEQNVPAVTLFRRLGFKIRYCWKFMRKNVSQRCYSRNYDVKIEKLKG